MNAQEIINTFPQPDGKILKTINKEACEKAVAQILKGGKEVVREIADLILGPGSGDDVRPRHALHATAIRVGGKGKRTEREAFSRDLADCLANDRPLAVKGFIIRQLQICAGSKEAKKIAPFLIKTDEHIYEYASQALQAIGKESIDYFRKAYPLAEGAPKLTILQSLGVLEDNKSRDFFLQAVKDEDLEIRLAGLWGLMRIASAEDAEILVKESNKESGWARIKATAYCFELAERLTANGQKEDARFIYRQIKQSRLEKDENYLRESAELALSVVNQP